MTATERESKRKYKSRTCIDSNRERESKRKYKSRTCTDSNRERKKIQMKDLY